VLAQGATGFTLGATVLAHVKTDFIAGAIVLIQGATGFTVGVTGFTLDAVVVAHGALGLTLGATGFTLCATAFVLATSVLMASIGFVAGVTTFKDGTADVYCGAAVILGTIAMKWPLSQLPVNSMRSGSLTAYRSNSFNDK
jgi:hypothetical protein